MKGIKEKFEEAAKRIFKKSFNQLTLEQRRRIRYMVCTDAAIAEEREKKKKGFDRESWLKKHKLSSQTTLI